MAPPGFYLLEKEIIRKEKIAKQKFTSIDNCLARKKEHQNLYDNDSNDRQVSFSSILIRGQSIENFNDALDKLEDNDIATLILDNQAIPQDKTLNLTQITDLTISNCSISKLLINAPYLQRLIIDKCSLLTNFDFINSLMYLKHLEIKGNKYINTIILPEDIEYAEFDKCPSLSSIKSISTYGLPNIHTLIVKGNNIAKPKPSMKSLDEIPLDMPELQHLHLESIWRMDHSTIKSNPPNTPKIQDPTVADKCCIDLPNSLGNLQHLSLTGFKYVAVPEDLVSIADLEHLTLSNIWATNMPLSGFYPRLNHVIVNNVNTSIINGLDVPNIVIAEIDNNYGFTVEQSKYWLEHNKVCSLKFSDTYLKEPCKLDLRKCIRSKISLPLVREIDICEIICMHIIQFSNMTFEIKNPDNISMHSSLAVFSNKSSIGNHKFSTNTHGYSYWCNSSGGIYNSEISPYAWRSVKYLRLIGIMNKDVISGKPRSMYANSRSSVST